MVGQDDTVATGALTEGSASANASVVAETGHFSEAACLNCRTALIGTYCHQCGQQRHLHRTLGAVLHDLLHGVLHLEGKTWRTLPMLAWKPGTLTRDYIDGHRARYVSPMALFLFSIFLMFAVFQASGISPPVVINPQVETDGSGADQLLEQRASAEASLAQLPAGDPGRADLETDLRDIDRELMATEQAVPALREMGSRFTDIRTGSPFIDKLAEKWEQNPGLMLYKMQANSYKFSWLLIPLSLPFTALLFAWRRRFGMYDHAVFVTYSLSFMTLLFVALTLLAQVGIGSSLLVSAGLLVPVWHIYRQLRGAYELSRFSALWRTAALIVLILLILLLFLNALVVLGAF